MKTAQKSLEGSGAEGAAAETDVAVADFFGTGGACAAAETDVTLSGAFGAGARERLLGSFHPSVRPQKILNDSNRH